MGKPALHLLSTAQAHGPQNLAVNLALEMQLQMAVESFLPSHLWFPLTAAHSELKTLPYASPAVFRTLCQLEPAVSGEREPKMAPPKLPPASQAKGIFLARGIVPGLLGPH